ncbi:unnamed protein product [Prorocentrum cordatum]|uniref:Uncharacterized protein n=1 Tax=Prorocentrum cordatum TaxID=2364126 RepID=A0ABN9S1A0_9DINO|nr:unnamed protein product [Polarella glacialis]
MGDSELRTTALCPALVVAPETFLSLAGRNDASLQRSCFSSSSSRLRRCNATVTPSRCPGCTRRTSLRPAGSKPAGRAPQPRTAGGGRGSSREIEEAAWEEEQEEEEGSGAEHERGGQGEWHCTSTA